MRRINSVPALLFGDSILLLSPIAPFARFAMNGLMPHWTSSGFCGRGCQAAIVDCQGLIGLAEIAQALLVAKCLIVGIFKSKEWNDLGSNILCR